MNAAADQYDHHVADLLPVTGFDVLTPLFIGLVFLVMGLALLYSARRNS